MSNLHPVMQQAIAPFIAPGFQRCSHVSPNPERGTVRFEYTLGEIDLACDIEYEQASGDGWNEPREPESATLCAAYVRDVDISELLDDDQRAEIEEAFLTQDRYD